MMNDLDIPSVALKSPLIIAPGLKAQGSLVSRSLEWDDIEMTTEHLIPTSEDDAMDDEASSIWAQILRTRNIDPRKKGNEDGNCRYVGSRRFLQLHFLWGSNL
jgi:hypothetical protein